MNYVLSIRATEERYIDVIPHTHKVVSVVDMRLIKLCRHARLLLTCASPISVAKLIFNRENLRTHDWYSTDMPSHARDDYADMQCGK